MSSPERAPDRGKSLRRALQIVISLAVIGLVFFFALPKIADYSKVWIEIKEMTWLELVTIAAVAVWNIVTYWFVMVASLPGSNYWQAMKVNQTSTAIANTMPGGGALGIGVTYGMYTSYGFTPSEIGLSIAVSGIWNNFAKLGMPVIALALLTLQGSASGSLIVAALAGVGALLGAILLFGLTLRSERQARAIGDRLGGAISSIMRMLRKPGGRSWGDAFARFRFDTIHLLKRRWKELTLATVVSHISLYLVLLLTLRHVGVSQADVGWIEVLAAFSFVRLISALPITPGGLGVVELGLTAALVTAGGNRAQVVASVLVYRALTYLVPIPFGIITYVQWQRHAERRRQRLKETQEAKSSASQPTVGQSPR
jgi:putative heme transporter